jgi:hypothetical protein
VTPTNFQRALSAKDEEIADLREEVSRLRQVLTPPTWLQMPLDWGLTRREGQILHLLYTREVLTLDAAMGALYFDDPEPPEEKIFQVWIAKIRRKTRRHGLVIDTVWGRKAYRIGPDAKAIIRQAIEPRAAA